MDRSASRPRAALARAALALATSLALGALALGPSVAHAQIAPGRNTPAPASKPKEPPPDALPGAHVDQARVTPLDKTNTDMPPTEALFDAINRGDIATARDAISRGADLAGRNLLGLTPLELSVDLGRNDITFLLLSYRGLDDTTHRAPPPQVAESRPGRAGARAQGTERAAGRAADRAADRAERQRAAATARAAARGQAAAPATPRTPQLYAGDGGTPVPNAGFLGFDAGRR